MRWRPVPFKRRLAVDPVLQLDGRAIPQRSALLFDLLQHVDDMLRGAIVEASFVVSNAGIATLLGSAAVEAPFSILSGTPFTLDQSISTNVVIRFAPATPGVFSGAVVFASDGGSSTNAVTGRAVGKVLLLSQGAVGADYLFSFDTVPGLAYIVQYKDDLTDLAWQILQTVPGDGTAKTVTNSMSTVSQRFYRLSVE